MSDLAITAAGRLNAAAAPADRLRQAARQFEAVFLREMMKPLEESQDGDEPLMGGDSASRQYRQLLDGALAEQSAGGLGVADTLVRALALRVPAERPAAVPAVSEVAP